MKFWKLVIGFVVLRQGKLVGEVATENASKESLAEMMVGRKSYTTSV